MVKMAIVLIAVLSRLLSAAIRLESAAIEMFSLLSFCAIKLCTFL